jgi:hypothetical protein
MSSKNFRNAARIGTDSKSFLAAGGQTAGNTSVSMNGRDDASGRQRWILTDYGSSTYRLTVAGGRDGPKILGASPTKGAKVVLYDKDDGSGRQKWKFRKIGDYWEISVANGAGLQSPKDNVLHLVGNGSDDVVLKAAEPENTNARRFQLWKMETAGQTPAPTQAPTFAPTFSPTLAPTQAPTFAPNLSPEFAPTLLSTDQPTFAPTTFPGEDQTFESTSAPAYESTTSPTLFPSYPPSAYPTQSPYLAPSPTLAPTFAPSGAPSFASTYAPADSPTTVPGSGETISPIASSTPRPTTAPSPDSDFLLLSATSTPSPSPSLSPTTYPLSHIGTTDPIMQAMYGTQPTPSPLPTPSPEPTCVQKYEGSAAPGSAASQGIAHKCARPPTEFEKRTCESAKGVLSEKEMYGQTFAFCTFPDGKSCQIEDLSSGWCTNQALEQPKTTSKPSSTQNSSGSGTNGVSVTKNGEVVSGGSSTTPSFFGDGGSYQYNYSSEGFAAAPGSVVESAPAKNGESFDVLGWIALALIVIAAVIAWVKFRKIPDPGYN